MGIYSNSPTMTWVSLTGISVTKGDEVFIVKDFKTNLKYIYWDYTNPYTFTASNVLKNTSTNIFQVAINDKGSFIEVPQTSIVVSYDGNSVQALSEHVWGLHEKDSEFTNRFVSVEQDISGITTTVGEHTEQMGVLGENISKVDQKANSINLSVQETKKEISDNKALMDLRESVNLSIINLNSALGIFKSLLNDYFKDNLISSDEKIQIQANIDIVNEKRNVMLSEMDKVSVLMTSQGKPENVTKINQDKTKLNSCIDNLNTLIKTAISDSNIVPSEITLVTNAFAKCTLDINDIKNTLDNMVFLGVGGKVSEELANISVKSDEIKLSVSSLEQNTESTISNLEDTFSNSLKQVKDGLEKEISDVSSSLGSLETTINTSFLDGVLSDSEKIALKRNLDTLQTEKVDVDNEYKSIYNNVALLGTPKTNLKTSYDAYVSKYNTLVSLITNVINKDGNLVSQDSVNISNAITEYRNSLGNLSTSLNNALDSITDNKKSDAISSSNAYADTIKSNLSKEISDVSGSLGSLTEEMNGAFKDGIVNEIEKKDISERINQLDKEKLDLDSQYTSVYSNVDLLGVAKTNLYNAKADYDSKHKDLKDYINTSISDGAITEEEKSSITTRMNFYNNSLATFNKRMQEAIDSISTKKKTDAVNSSNSYADGIKSTLSKEIGDINTSVGDLTETMNGAFKDGIISEAESKAISERIVQLDKEKLDLDKQYSIVYANADISSTAKTNLASAKTDYNNKHSVLKTSINNAISDGIVDENEKNIINTNTTNYNNALTLLSQRLTEAIDSISSNKVSTVDKKYSEILIGEDGIVSKVGKIETTVNGQATTISQHTSSISQMANQITSKVSAGDIASTINQTAQGVRISASKVNLDGYTTFTNLSTAGQTTIDGANIKTGTIYVDRLNSNNPNPIIRLFGGCSLDATKAYEQGQGNSIRLKYDAENYIRVSPSHYNDSGQWIEANISFFSGLNPGKEVFVFKGNASWGQIITSQGILKMDANNVSYQGTNLSKEGHTHSGYATTSSLSNYATVTSLSSYAKKTDLNSYATTSSLSSYAKRYSSDYMQTGSIDPYVKDSYNLGYSGCKWNQVVAKSVYGESGSVSDKRFKENIIYLDDINNFTRENCTVLNENLDTKQDTILSKEDLFNFIKNDLKLTQYNYISEYAVDNFNNKLNFIANDIVDTKVGSIICADHEGYLAYNLNNYVSVLAGALQEEIKKREELEERIKVLEEMILNK